MKRISIITILFFFIYANSFATNYYVNAATGSDIPTNGLSPATPWKTGAYACGRVTTVGANINFAAGTYYEPNVQWQLAVGVNLVGAGSGSCHIHPKWFSTSTSSAFIMLVSGGENTNGNQSISGFDFNMQGTDSSSMCILVKLRSNVIVHDITFENFKGSAALFNGKSTSGAPGSYCVGNQWYNITTTDCADRQSTAGNGGGVLGWWGQSGNWLIHDWICNQTGRPQTHNGDGIGMVGNGQGCYSKNGKIYNCTFHKPLVEGNSNNFAIEDWYDQGGIEVYGNTFDGGGDAIDIGVGAGGRTDSTFSWHIHDNIFTASSQIPTYPVQPLSIASMGVQFEVEASPNAGYALIHDNQFINTATALQITMTHGTVESLSNVKFYNNLCYNMGYADGGYGGYMVWINAASGAKMDSTFIYNNTMLGSTGAGKARTGIFLLAAGLNITNTFIQNNIVENTAVNGWLYYGGTNSISGVRLQNNDAFNNTFTNNPFTAGTPTISYTSNSGNIKSDPLFVSTSSNNYHLNTGSPCLGTGLNPPNTYMGYVGNGTITPTITWTTPSPITYGTLLSATQLNASFGGVPGTAVYTPGSGTQLNAGLHQRLIVVFTPSDLATYSVVADTVYIDVNQAIATLAASGTTLPYTGFPQQPTITTNPVGLTVINTTYNGIGTIPSNASVNACISGLANSNYVATPISYTFTITPLAGTFTASNQTFQYDSLLHTITVTVSNPLITYTISNVPQRYKGVYNVTIHNTNTNFSVPDLSITLTITAGQAPPLSWSPADMVYPAAIGSPQTNATDAKTGTYNYTPTTSFVPSAGSLQLKVDFFPSDTNLAPIIGTTRTINVAKRTDVITVIDTIQYADGTSKTIHPTTLYGGTLNITGGTGTAVGDYPYSVSYTDANNQAATVNGTLHILSNAANIYMTNYQNLPFTGSPLSPNVVCAYPYTLAFSPSNHTNVNASIRVIATINDGGVHVGADTVFMNIIPATPIGTWAAISPVSYIYTVQSGILNAATATAGTWAYNVSVGDTLVPGTYNLLARFTPTDAIDFNSIVLSNSITVNKGSATISITNQSKQYNTQVQYATVTTTPPNLDSLVVVYTGNHKDVGSYLINASLFSNLYTATSVVSTLTISQGSYTLSWATPLAIQQNTSLNYALPTSSIAGTFTFNYPIGYIAQNNLTLIATFHPTDTNYPVQVIQVFQSVYGVPFGQPYFIINGKTIYLNLPNQ